MGVRVIEGDCLAAMAEMPDNSIDAVVTDPPAGITFMGRDWDHHKGGRDQWVAWMESVARECLRVLKPGAHAAVWALPKTAHWTAWAWESAGFGMPREKVYHLFGSGFPKSLDVGKAIDKAAGAEREVIGTRPIAYPDSPSGYTSFSARSSAGDGAIWGAGAEGAAKGRPVSAPATEAARQWEGWGTALKPAAEEWLIFRKPLSEPTVAANVLKWGTGALNIDASRVYSNYQRPIEGETWESEESLCASCAEHAEPIEKPGTPGTRAFTATNGAEPTLSGKAETGHGDTSKTDIGCFNGRIQTGREDTSSSIVGCGNRPTDPYPSATTSTTSTATSSTIGLKTCVACGATITCKSTPSTRPRKSAEPLIKKELGNTGLSVPGRWPPNLSHDGSPEVLEAFETFGERRTAGNIKPTRQTIGYTRGSERVVVPVNHQDAGTAARYYPAVGFEPDELRFLYCGKASRREREAGVIEQGLRASHPTVKPLALMRWLCRLVTPPGGTVLDPFLGSGSTAIACLQEGFGCVGIEREAEYAAIARARLAHHEKLPPAKPARSPMRKRRSPPPAGVQLSLLEVA